MIGERLRKGVLSAAFVLGLVGVLSGTLVGLPGAGAVARRLRAPVTLTALDQDWRLFAPEPPRSAQRLDVVITWSDARETTWRIPLRDPWAGAYTDYRWRKWAENAGSDDVGPTLWRATARFALAQLPSRAGARPMALRIVRARAAQRPAGDRRPLEWTTGVLYRARLAPGPSS